jgi:L-glyceraldehyde 3-phosphate reductase
MYTPNEKRYDKTEYRQCGKSGLKMSALSLGLWKNFGSKSPFDNMEKMVHTAFDCGICCFDLANCYGSPDNGAAEENFGRILDKGLRAYRDELCISTKAGFYMWSGPYGDKNGSAKNLTASLDGSLKRMGLEYVDIFYHHIADPDTSAEETALALDKAVKDGKALYVGISNYDGRQTEEIASIFRELHTPFIVNQLPFSVLDRESEEVLRVNDDIGIGTAVFSPLYQGFLSDRYLNGIPADSRVGKGETWVGEELDDKMISKLRQLNCIAQARGQSLSQMALAWILSHKEVTTVIIGASCPEQITENARCTEKPDFSEEELLQIDMIICK